MYHKNPEAKVSNIEGDNNSSLQFVLIRTQDNNLKNMIEVFKTNVQELVQARKLIRQIHQNFQHYQANFDLEDCDKILRVACYNGLIQTSQLINFLRTSGYQVEVLMDSDEEVGFIE